MSGLDKFLERYECIAKRHYWKSADGIERHLDGMETSHIQNLIIYLDRIKSEYDNVTSEDREEIIELLEDKIEEVEAYFYRREQHNR